MTDHVGHNMSADGSDGGDNQRKEIYTYDAPWPIFSMAWSHRCDAHSHFRLAIGSCVEKYSNAIQIVKKRPPDSSSQQQQQQQQHDEYDSQLYNACELDHPYPCTKILWSPDARSHSSRDLLATTGDYLRIWNIEDDGSGEGTEIAKKEFLFCKNIQNKRSEYCAPLPSFDWNETDPNIIGTASFDTTCAIWDVTTQTMRTQIIAHDREVFDLAFGRGKDTFASVGGDGSLRMFDLRRLDHSTIVYESPKLCPLLRLEWNKQDLNYLATFTSDSLSTIILDLRMPSAPVAELGGHTANVNATAWAPHSFSHICTGGDDSQALIWDVSAMKHRPVEDPILAYNAEAEINNLKWSATEPDWISIAFKNKLQILRV